MRETMAFSQTLVLRSKFLLPQNDPVGFQRVGNPLVGVPTKNTATSLFGKTVTLSSSANGSRPRLLVGSPTHGFSTPTADDSAVNQDGGAVFLYELDDSEQSWYLVWFLPGRKGEAMGSTLALSADGSRVALRRRRGTGIASDFVEMYHVSSKEEGAVRLGSPIGCIGGGTGLAMDTSGVRVAVSCENFENERGRVEVFDYDGMSWVPTGAFQGESSGSLFGWSTAFSADGSRLAISAPSYTFDQKRRDCGMVQVFELQNDKSWVQVGGNIIGYNKFEGLGMSLDLSGDGRTVVVGSPGSNSNDAPRSGAVRAFFDFRGVWMQTGSDIPGTYAGDEFGEAVSVSENGGRIAASSPNHGNALGHIRVFDLDVGAWVQHGHDIIGIEGGTRLGYGRSGVSLDGDGTHLAYGSPFCGLTGCVRVVEIISTPDLSKGEEPQQPITTRGEANEGSDMTKMDWDIDFIDASVSFTDSEPATIDLEYEIHARANAVTVFEADCNQSVNETVYSIETRTKNLSTSKQSLSVDIKFNPGHLSESAIYTEPGPGNGVLAICVRVDLLNEDKVSISFDQRRLSIVLDTSMNFEVLDVQIDETQERTEVKASVEYAVTACQCDENLVCIDKPVNPDGDTLLCLGTEMEGLKVASIEQLQFFQGSLSQIAVRNRQEEDLTIVEWVGEHAVVRTRLVSAFFEGDENLGIHARGKCILSFVHGGHLRALRHGFEGRGLSRTDTSFSVDLRAEKAVSSASVVNLWGVVSIVLAIPLFWA